MQNPKENHYDIIIAGAGAAGLLLAYTISQQKQLSRLKILLVDPVKKTDNDRTWCFWTKEKTPFETILTKYWEQLEFLSDFYSHTFELNPYQYKMLRSEQLYKFIWETLEQSSHINFFQAKVEGVEEVERIVKVSTNKEVFTTDKVFDSRLSKEDFRAIDSNYHLILQHFKGYIIETQEASFDDKKMRMFDFRIPQKKQVRFVYVLPLTPQKALVEFTVFSENLLEKPEYDEALNNYLKKHLQLENFKLLEEEEGVIPMTDYPFKRKIGNNIFKIGTQGGMCKPSTGYAFLNMLKDAQDIVKQLTEGKPLKLKQSEKRFQFYDVLLLDIIKRDGGSIAYLFSDMFKNNSIQRIFRFLSEESTYKEDIQVMYSLPSMPFFKSIFNILKR